MNSRLLNLLILLFSAPALAETVLRQVHVVTRHGARTPLPKDADTLLESAGSILTPTGQKQQYELGEWLKTRYSSLIVKYDPSLHRLESSALDRTLVSANSLALGLFSTAARFGDHNATVFPEKPANIPVYMETASNDITIRSYQTCPLFQERLADLYDSANWKTLENSASQDLLRELAEIFPDMVDGEAYVSLKDAYTAYDAIHVAKTECDENPFTFSCLSLPNPDVRNILSQNTWLQLEELTHAAEKLRYGMQTAGNLLGSNLLWRIMNRMADGRTSTRSSDQSEGQFFLYSAHYPTLLGLFSVLHEIPPTFVLPDYAAALIFELHQDSKSGIVSLQVYYKEGEQPNVTPVILNQACKSEQGGTMSDCPLTRILVWAGTNTLTTQEDWCRACRNTAADVCMKDAMKHPSVVQNIEKALSKGGTGNGIVVGAAIGSFIGGLVLGLIIMRLCCSGKANSNKKESAGAVGYDEESISAKDSAVMT
jgi:hypothetical protein